jgi:hypothetical protein
MVGMAVSLLDKGRWLRRPSERTPRRGVCGDRLLSGHGRSAGGCLDGGRGAESTAHSQATKPVKLGSDPTHGHHRDHRSEHKHGRRVISGDAAIVPLT